MGHIRVYIDVLLSMSETGISASGSAALHTDIAGLSKFGEESIIYVVVLLVEPVVAIVGVCRHIQGCLGDIGNHRGVGELLFFLVFIGIIVIAEQVVIIGHIGLCCFASGKRLGNRNFDDLFLFDSLDRSVLDNRLGSTEIGSDKSSKDGLVLGDMDG